MGRRATGTIQRHGDHYDARVTLPDGRRPWICLPPGETEARARERAAAMSEMARAPGSTYDPQAAKVPESETLGQYIVRRADDRVARGLVSARNEPLYLRKHCGRLWERPMAAITRDEIEALVEEFDSAVAEEEWAGSTAKKIFQTVCKAFADATTSKTRALRILSANPCQGVLGPDASPKRSKCWLYPSEFLKLVSCQAVPRRRRRVYAVAVYLYARLNEIRAIALDDVDPEHGLVHIHRALEQQTGDEKTTKSGLARRVPVEPNILPLVRVLHEEARAAEQERLLILAQIDWAERLREDLRVAGVDRAELFADDRTRQPLRFHDLRATGITWAGIRGDDPLKIRQRAGHAKFATTEVYLRTAEVVGPGVGTPFPSLPEDLLLPVDEAPPPTQTEARL